jgi:hypothetical protein
LTIPGIQGVYRIELAKYPAVQALIGPDGAEFAAEHRTLPLGHLDLRHAAAAHVLGKDGPGEATSFGAAGNLGWLGC